MKSSNRSNSKVSTRSGRSLHLNVCSFRKSNWRRVLPRRPRSSSTSSLTVCSSLFFEKSKKESWNTPSPPSSSRGCRKTPCRRPRLNRFLCLAFRRRARVCFPKWMSTVISPPMRRWRQALTFSCQSSTRSWLIKIKLIIQSTRETQVDFSLAVYPSSSVPEFFLADSLRD